jgi:crotonobetainyl-CoA:carnitine CoA-transferase CaiB-like acyl-CoA transferase
VADQNNGRHGPADDRVCPLSGAPLEGIRVVEAGTYMSAPFAGMMLAQLGAEVVKVEPPTGDQFRRFSLCHGGASAAWIGSNHGKRSVVLDLKDPAGQGDMYALLRDADVFVQNWRPSVAHGLGLDGDELSARFPALIHLAISGYGETGPNQAFPVFDGLLQASSGFAVTEAGKGNRPAITRSFVVDKTTASFAAQSILAALFQRERTGRGARLELAMLDVMAYFNFPDLCQDRAFLPPAPQRDLSPGRSPVLRTLDGYIIAAPVTGRQIVGAITAVGHPEWKDDLKLITEPADLMDELINRLETVTSGWSSEASLAAFRGYDIPAALVLDVDQHFNDAQTIHNNVYSDGETPFGPVRRVRYPLLIDGHPLAHVQPAPSLGNTAPAKAWSAPDER